ncbi:MAG TPA: YggT family protein [Holophaga sp.]|jgi:YggT family protein|nr:YggT family protein [Holophaga sp.]
MPFLVVLVNWGISLLILVLFISAILSWFNPDPRHPVIRGIQAIVDPILRPIRAIIPPMGGFDLSPLIAFLVLRLLQSLIRDAILRGVQ